jgi:hypothetical protein
LGQLFFDLARWWWLEITPFLAYLARLRRKRITIQETLKKPSSGTKFHPLPLQFGESSGINIRRQLSFGHSFMK